MNTHKNQPADTIRDSDLKATIWKNVGEKGNFYSVEISRTYQDAQGNYHDSHSFSGAELLRVAHLATKAYERIGELRQQDRIPANTEAAQ